MNSGNSNTSGQDVASIASWPKSVLGYVRSSVTQLAGIITKLITGEATAAQLDFSPKGYSDKISDAQMAEIARRLVVTFENSAASTIVLSPTPPEDKTKIWGQTDPTSGVLIGQLKKYDAEAEAWVPTVEAQTPYVAPKESLLVKQQVSAGNQTVNIALGRDMGRTDYFLSITPTSWNGTIYGSPVASFPDAHGWQITNKTGTEITVAFFAVPTGGMTYEIWARNQENPPLA